MIHGLYISAAGALVQDSRMDVIANNVANTATPGFKGDFAQFMVRSHEAIEAGMMNYSDPRFRDVVGGGVFLRSTETNFQTGVIHHTGDPFNVAIQGEGFLTASDGKETFYTRSGSFTMTKDGNLKTRNGRYDILNEGGGAIRLDTGLPVKIHDNGDIEQGGIVVAKLGIAKFDDTAKLRKFGHTLFRNTGEKNVTVGEGRVKQGYIERSNVDAVSAMTELIEAARMFELNMRLLQMQDGTLSRLMIDVASVA